MSTILEYMTKEQAEAYRLAAALAVENKRDRRAWSAAVAALRSAEKRAYELNGEVKLNGYLYIAGCFM